MGSRGEGRKIVDVEITDVQKRRTPSKHYVYIINVTWSDGVANVIYRRYSRFFDFQHILLGKFPVESGQLDPNKRVIPFLPGKIYFGRSHVRDVALKRLQPIEEYCKSLINLPEHISQCEDVQDFFDIEPDDLNPEDDYEKKKKSANFEVNKISGPKLAEQYRVIADYKKEDKWDLNLKAGTEVEVVEKSESGWWFVSVEDQQGWVPSTYLKRKDGASEIFSQRAKPGEEESYISTESYEPASNDEIRLDKGAVVDVIEKKLDGWWFVRYKGLEGWAPATYLMKAEKAHMQRVARASGVEIVGGLSDISTLIKGEGSQPEIAAAPPRPHIPKLYKKSASMERGGSIRPPPRQNSIKNINVDALKPSLSREDRRYVTLAEFHDTVGDGISFEKGEIVHVKEKNDGGWWFVKIGQKEGWAPSSFLTKADLDDVSEDGQDPIEDPDYSSVAVESDDDDDDTDDNTINDSNEWEDENVYEEVEYEVPQTSHKQESKTESNANKSEVFMPNVGIKIASKFKRDSENLPTVQQKSREKSPRRALGHSTGYQRPTSRPPPPPMVSKTENVETKGNAEKLRSIGINRDSLATALSNQLQAKLSSDSSKSSSDGERSETGKSKPLLPAKPTLSDGLNRSPLETDRKSRFEFGNKSPKHSRGSSPRGSEQQEPPGGSLADMLKSKFEKRQVPNTEAIDSSSKGEGQFHTYPKKPLIPPSMVKAESKEVDKDTSTNSYKSLPLPKMGDRPLTPPKTVKSATNLQVSNKETPSKRHSMQEEGSDLASLLKAKFESRRQSADVPSTNYSSVDKNKKNLPQKPLLPPKFDKNKSKKSEESVSGKPPCLPKPDIGSDTNTGKRPSVAAALKSKFEGAKQTGKPKLPGAKPAKPAKPLSASATGTKASSLKTKSSDSDKNIKTVGIEIPVKSGFAKSLAAKLAGNVPGADKPVLAPNKGDNSSNLSSAVSEESQNYSTIANTKHYKTLAGYFAESEGEISFNEGVMVEVLDKSDGWWLVKINQEEGWAPATYIEEVEMDQDVSTTERSASPVIDSGFTSPEEGSNSVSSQKYRTTAEFVGESDSELGFKEGVYVEVLDCSDDDWWYVRIDGNEGWVPADFLEEV